MKDVKLIILSHYDFVDKTSGNQVKGSKVVLTLNGKSKLEMSTKSDEVFSKEPLVQTYTCDLFINEDLKIDIKNVR